MNPIQSDWPLFSALLKILALLAALVFFAAGCKTFGGIPTCAEPAFIYEVQSCGAATSEGSACFECQGASQCINNGTLNYCVATCGMDTACSAKNKATRRK